MEQTANISARAPADQLAALECSGCGQATLQAALFRLRADHMPPGLGALVCHRCRSRCQRSPRFRRSLEVSTAAGVSRADVARVFAQLGVFDVPTIGEECDEALGLPAGATAAALGGR